MPRETLAREGVELERSTLAGMVGGAAALLKPLIGALERHVLAADKLHGDTLRNLPAATQRFDSPPEGCFTPHRECGTDRTLTMNAALIAYQTQPASKTVLGIALCRPSLSALRMAQPEAAVMREPTKKLSDRIKGDVADA